MKLKDLKKKTLGLILLTLVAGGGALYFRFVRAGLLMPITDLPAVIWLSFLPPDDSFHPQLEGEELLNRETSLQQLLGDDFNQDNVTILVEKSKYRLTVFSDRQPIKSYPVVFGDSPSAGDKLREGDRKTPEGVYFIRDLYPHQGWSKFLWIDYPRPSSWREHFQAKLSGELGWQHPIGGEIGIHGVPSGTDSRIGEKNNWTLGCISLTNKDVDEIYEVVKAGTLVEIVS